MFKSLKIFIICFLFLGLTACKTQEMVAEQNTAKLPKIKDKELIDRIDSLSRIEPKTFYSKLTVSYMHL